MSARSVFFWLAGSWAAVRFFAVAAVCVSLSAGQPAAAGEKREFRSPNDRFKVMSKPDDDSSEEKKKSSSGSTSSSSGKSKDSSKSSSSKSSSSSSSKKKSGQDREKGEDYDWDDDYPDYRYRRPYGGYGGYYGGGYYPGAYYAAPQAVIPVYPAPQPRILSRPPAYDGGYYTDGYTTGQGYREGYLRSGRGSAGYGYEDYYGRAGGYSAGVSVVRSAQARLAAMGYYDGAADGVFGPRTRSAVEQLQYDYRLPVTGQLDRRTLAVLGL